VWISSAIRPRLYALACGLGQAKNCDDDVSVWHPAWMHDLGVFVGIGQGRTRRSSQAWITFNIP